MKATLLCIFLAGCSTTAMDRLGTQLHHATAEIKRLEPKQMAPQRDLSCGPRLGLKRLDQRDCEARLGAGGTHCLDGIEVGVKCRNW